MSVYNYIVFFINIGLVHISSVYEICIFCNANNAPYNWYATYHTLSPSVHILSQLGTIQLNAQNFVMLLRCTKLALWHTLSTLHGSFHGWAWCLREFQGIHCKIATSTTQQDQAHQRHPCKWMCSVKHKPRIKQPNARFCTPRNVNTKTIHKT